MILNVLRRSLIFWGVLRCYSGFWRFQRRSKLFWGLLGHSGIFCEVLMHFHTYWAVLIDFWRIWVILWNCGVFSRVSEAFLLIWALLKGSSRITGVCLTFWDVLRLFDLFSYVLSSAKSLLKNVRRFLVFWGVFWGFKRRSEAFSWVLSGCEMFLNVLKCTLIFWGYSEVFWGIWRYSHGSWVVLERLLTVLTHSLMICVLFWSSSEALSSILKGFWRFWGILWRSGGVERCSEEFSWILNISEHLWNVHMRVIRGVLVGSERFLKIPCRSFLLSGVFWGILKRSHWLWVCLKGSWTFCRILWPSGVF